jgi:hypothetical protein
VAKTKMFCYLLNDFLPQLFFKKEEALNITAKVLKCTDW